MQLCTKIKRKKATVDKNRIKANQGEKKKNEREKKRETDQLQEERQLCKTQETVKAVGASWR